MAQEKITIKFEPKGHKTLIDALNKLKVAQGNVAKGQHLVNQRQSAGTKSGQKLTETFSTLRNKLLLFNFAMALGVRELIQFTKESAKVEAMGRAFNTLQGGTENASIAMGKLKEATNGTMSQFDLFQQANNAMILGITKNSDEMAEMFDIAQRLGQALGKDTKMSVESLITGIGRQSRLMLDNIGIIVDSNKAYSQYAQKIGIASDKLTDAQKKTAFLEATMTSAREKVAGLGDEIVDMQQKMERVSAAFSDTRIGLGRLVTSVFNLDKNLRIVSDSIDNANTLFKKNVSSANDYNNIIQFTVQSLIALNPKLLQTARWLGVNVEQIKLFKEESEGIFENFPKFPDITDIFPTLSMEQVPFYLNPNSVGERSEQVLKILKEMGVKEEFILQKRLKIATMAINVLGDILGVNSKNAKLVANIQALAALVDAFAMAQSASMQATKNPMTIINPAYPKIIYGLTLAQGLAQAAAVKASADKLEQGGLIGGRRHSQGGTIIEAEQGEFIMRRDAVESIGIENLNNMNQGSAGVVTVNISAPLVDESVVNHIIPAINEAVRRGERLATN